MKVIVIIIYFKYIYFLLVKSSAVETCSGTTVKNSSFANSKFNFALSSKSGLWTSTLISLINDGIKFGHNSGDACNANDVSL